MNSFPSKNSKIYVFIVLSMIFWAFSFIWTKIALLSFPPLTLITLRLILASFLLYIFLKLTKRFYRLRKKDVKLFLLLAFFEPFLYYIGETHGLVNVEPTLAAIIIATIPVFAPFFAFIFLKERFTMINILGIIISVFGVFLIVYKSSEMIYASLNGIFLLLLAVVSAIIYGLILRKIPSQYSATNIIFHQSLLGLIFFIPTTLLFDLGKYAHYTVSVEAISALLMLVIFASIIAFILFADVVRKIGITKSEVFTNLIPVFTALISWLIFRETMNFLQWIGIFVVILGVLISQGFLKLHLNKALK